MAEYKDVMHHLKRMCESYRFCDDGCPLCDRTDGFHMRCMAKHNGASGIFPPADIIEHAVMKWAAKHPEPKLVYPTWEEWYKCTYPKGKIRSFCPKIYDGDYACVLPALSCNDCRKQRIPEHIAKALCVKPVEEKMSKTEIIKIKGDWQDVVDGCRETVAKPPLGHEPSDKFKTDILIAEHEPIREIEVKWRWRSIKYWIAMHWKTHIWPGRTNTQRDDRTGVNRDESPQAELITFTGRANPQHLIDTFRKRLCRQAHEQTRLYAEDFKATLRPVQPEISHSLVPNCVYRCGCPETRCCGMWGEFLKWCKDSGLADPRTVSIKVRYAMYNHYFYEAVHADAE